MIEPLRLMAITAHPDDESLGLGGSLARYANEGVETYVVCATRGQSGRHGGEGPHPGPAGLGRIREAELRAAATELGVTEVIVLDYLDAHLAEAEPQDAITDIVSQLRRVQPDVVLTFAADGAYGHPDHIAVSQFATAATVAAANSSFGDGEPHQVSKLYHMAWGAALWEAYQAAFKKLTSTVDGVVRQATPWPEWAITTRIDARPFWRTVWRAVQRHQSQVSVFEALKTLPEDTHETLWGEQTFYRVYSTVNGGRATETDLFEGLRESSRESDEE